MSNLFENHLSAISKFGGKLMVNSRKNEYLVSLDSKVLAKRCNKCFLWKENIYAEFNRNETGLGGTMATCKVCKKARQSADYHRNGGRERAKLKYREKNKFSKSARSQKDSDDIYKFNQQGTRYLLENGVIVEKECTKCGQIKKIKHGFTKNKRGFAGVNAHCNECRKEGKAKYAIGHYHLNKHKRKYSKATNAIGANKRRARKKSLPDTITRNEMNKTFEFFGGCAFTGDKKDYHWDHVIPLSTGYGGTVFENMVPVNSNLNISKQNSNLFVWFYRNQIRHSLKQEKFEKLILYLSQINNMTIFEYTAYVYECHNNPRELVTPK